MVWIEAALAIGGALYGSKGDKEANKENEKRYQELLKLYEDLGKKQTKFFNQERLAIEGGFDKAQSMLGGVEQAGLRFASEQGEKARGFANVGLVNSGLFGSEAMRANLGRSIASDTSRTAGEIYANLGRARSGVQQNRTQAMAGLFRGQSAAEAARTNALAGVIEGRTDLGTDPAYYANLGKMLGGLFSGKWGGKKGTTGDGLYGMGIGGF
jgi:hypothetical protein